LMIIYYGRHVLTIRHLDETSWICRRIRTWRLDYIKGRTWRTPYQKYPCGHSFLWKQSSLRTIAGWNTSLMTLEVRMTAT
jgi:hypothetical protein